jgi:hypothetical protein
MKKNNVPSKQNLDDWNENESIQWNMNVHIHKVT